MASLRHRYLALKREATDQINEQVRLSYDGQHNLSYDGQQTARSDPLHTVLLLHMIDEGLPVRKWRLRGLYAKIRGPYQDQSQ